VSGQFLDIGTGIPSANNTHEGRAVDRTAEAVSCTWTNDPIVLAHAPLRCWSAAREGTTDYLDADLRETGKDPRPRPAGCSTSPSPVAVMLVAVLHLIGPEDHPHGIVSQLMDAVPPGSYLLLSHVASDIEAGRRWPRWASGSNRLLAQKGYYRSQARGNAVSSTGLELLEPGRRPGAALAPGLRDRGRPGGRPCGGGVARKNG